MRGSDYDELNHSSYSKQQFEKFGERNEIVDISAVHFLRDYTGN
jgi:hypothetical protein